MKSWVVFVARALALLWAVFWLIFFVAESLAWDTPVPVMASWAGAGLLLVVLALVPWRWEAPGGLLLVAAGVSSGAAYAIWPPTGLPVAGRLLTVAVLAVPPLAAGIMFLQHHRAAGSGT